MIRFGVLLVLASALGGCVSVRNDSSLVPPTALCTNFRAPITMPRGSVDLVGLKIGECGGAWHLKEWVFSGASAGSCDMLLKEAAQNGGIDEILFADYEQVSYFGFLTSFKVTVYGR